MSGKRIMFLDFIKGLAAMMVVMVHLPEKVGLYNTTISFVMVPLFFFASGYLTSVPQKHIIRDFLYKRVAKLFVLYAIYAIILPFTSITEIKQIVGNPILIIEKLVTSITKIFIGKAFWFVACLIVINIIFFIVTLVSRRNNIAVLAVSTILCIVGVIISEREMMPWHLDTALVCQLIFVAGYLTKEYDILAKIKMKKTVCIASLMLYLAVVFAGCFFFGTTEISIDCVLDIWGIWYISIPAIILGVVAFVLIGELSGGVKFINYIGAHSLLYFAFASHGGSIFVKLFAKIYSVTNFSLFSNPYIINPAACILGCLLMIIPCLLIDKFVPFLNGKFKMPVPKKYA